MDPAIAAAFEATWPAAGHAEAGGFRVARGQGAGRRVGSARAIGPWTPDDIDAATALHAVWGQTPAFRVDDDDDALIAALSARGFRRQTPTAIMQVAARDLTERAVPQMTVFAVWPPLAIQRDIWAAGQIGPARQAVMERAAAPKTALLGRTGDRAAGTGFAAIHAGVAMVHAVEILPDWRRRGLAAWMMRGAARWARENGADRLALAVTRANAPALALYRDLGFTEAGGYAYFVKP